MVPRTRVAVAGAIAAGPALAILMLARLDGGSPGILEVVADGVVRHMPAWLFDWGLRILGPAAKGTLFGIVCLGVPIAGAVGALALQRLMLLTRDRPVMLAMVAASVMLAVGELLVLPVAGAGLTGTSLRSSSAAVHVPLVLASVAYGVLVAALLMTWSALYRRQEAAAESSPDAHLAPRAAAVSRRSLLSGTVVAVGIGAYGLAVAGLVSHIARATRSAVPGAPDLAGVEGFGYQRAVTPSESFYVVTKDYAPMVIDPVAWRLSVSGLVDVPFDWTLDELRRLPSQAGYRTLQCISAESVTRTELIGNQRWEGVRVRDVLDVAGVGDGASHVIWRCADGYHESTDLPTALHDDTWLVYGMGPAGTPLPADHGAPLRLLVAGRYGMAQPKHLTGLIVADHDEPGWWVTAGWRTDAPVRTYCRIDLPVSDGIADAVVAGTTFMAYGVASSGDRGISGVQVSIDGGTTWRDAEIEPYGDPIGRLTWVRWRMPVTLSEPGTLLFMARAADGNGVWQEEAVETAFPRGASGYPRVPMRVYAGVDDAGA